MQHFVSIYRKIKQKNNFLDVSKNPMTGWRENVSFKHPRNSETLSGLNPNLCSLFQLNQARDASKDDAVFRAYQYDVIVVFQVV